MKEKCCISLPAGRQVFFLDFLVLFYQEKSTEEKLLLKINISSRYFTFLSWHKKVTKKVKAPEKWLKRFHYATAKKLIIGKWILIKRRLIRSCKNITENLRCLTLHSIFFLTPFFWCHSDSSFFGFFNLHMKQRLRAT